MIDVLTSKAVAGLLGLLLFLGACEYVSHLQDSLAYAQEASKRLEGQLAAQMANGKAALAIAGRNADAARERSADVKKLQEEVRHAKVPVPENCRSIMLPVRRALDGVRRLQTGSGGAGAAAAGVRG